MHSMQTLIVALLVPGCTLYATWKLMPTSARRALATSMLRTPHLPTAIETRLRRSVQAGTGCGCDGCDRAATPPAQTGTARPLTFHPRAKR